MTTVLTAPQGFITAATTDIAQLFNNKTHKTIHIDTMIEQPYMFLNRSIVKTAHTSLDDGNLIISSGKGLDNKSFMSIPYDLINNSRVKEYGNDFDIWFEILNVTYNIYLEN